MKRALSFILALTLALTLLPTFASAETTETMNWDEPVVFNLAAPTDTKSLALGENDSRTIGKKTTNSEGEVVVNNAEKKFYGENWAGWTSTSCKMIQAGRNDNTKVTYKNGREYVLFQVATTDYNKYDTYILALKIPASGIYNITSDIWNSASGGAVEALLNDVSIGGFDFFATTDDDGVAKRTREYSAGKGVAVAKTVNWTEGTVNISENKFTLDFNWYDGLDEETVEKTTNGIYNLTFTPSTINSAAVTAPATEYKVNDTFTPSVSLNVEGVGDKTYSDLAQAGIVLGVKEANAGVTVSDNVYSVTKSGEVTFTPTVTVNGKTHEATEVTITVLEEDEGLTDAFIQEDAKKDITESYVAPTVTGTDFTGKVFTAEKNTDGTFTLTAPEKNSAEKLFLYWAKGMDTQKKIISFENVINNYVPAENGRNYLIAVYEGDIADTTNEYYNLNGQLIAKQADAPDYPSIPGLGTAKEWKHCSGNIYVAEYADLERDNVTVTVNGGTGTQKNVPYGTLITCTADETKENFKCWKKEVNGVSEIVSIDDSYTFHAWETCTVEAVYADHYYTGSNMKILIDSFAIDTGVTGVMAEFIGFEDEDVVEKGIKFTATGETEAIKIPMTTTDNQLTVVADAGKYEGYAILRSDNAYQMITDGSYEHN